MQAGLWTGVALAIMLAVASGLADVRGTRRDDPDRVSLIEWRGVQMAAMFGAALLALLAIVLSRRGG